jgi:hypothetical protein
LKLILNTFARRCLGVLALVTFLWSGSAHGQIVVTNATDAALRAAIDSANTTGQEIQLRFTSATTITLTSTLEITGNIVLHATGSTVTLSGSSSNRVFHVIGGRALTLNNIEITAGRAIQGAAVYNEGGTFTAINCVFSSNLATNASGSNGADSTSGGDGKAGKHGEAAYGGAIYNSGKLFVYDSSFITNAVYAGDGGDGGAGGQNNVVGGKGGKGGNGGDAIGGAIYNASTGTAEIYRTDFEGNICSGGLGGTPGTGGSGRITGDGGDSGLGGASLGAGLYNAGSLMIVQSLFNGNKGYAGNSSGVVAYPQGGYRKAGNGAVSIGGGLMSKGSVYVENSTFYENTCEGGTGGSVTTGGYTYSGNGGNACGGAVAITAGTAEFVNCTLATNNAVGGTNGTSGVSSTTGSKGDSLGGNLYRAGGKLTVRNTLLSSGTNGANAYGTVVDGGYNISSDASCKFKAKGSLNRTSAQFADELADNGGNTYSLALLASSPAVDAIPASGLYPMFDQRGVTRPQGNKVDIGAFELEEESLSPTVTIDPESTNVIAGARTTLSVTAMGASPLKYQWSVNGIDILYATNATYTIAAASVFDEGEYAVTVSNDYGDASSSSAWLEVITPVTIVTQPMGLSAIGGKNFSLSVFATGEGTLSYQWYRGKTAISGQIDSVLSIDSAQPGDAGNYWVLVSNDAGSVKSASALVNVLMPVSITTQPVDQAVTMGKTATFSVAATGTAPLHYQWYFNGIPLTGATSAKLTIPKTSLANGGSYTVIVSNTVNSVESDPAAFSLQPPAPTVSSTKLIGATNLFLQGTFATNANIQSIKCRIGATTYAAQLNGSRWTATVPLTAGSNVVVSYAIATFGFSEGVTSQYFLTVKSPLSLTASGEGSFSPNLNGQSLIIGKSYSVTAKPGARSMFQEWQSNGVTVAATPKLTFTMTEGLELTAVFADDPFASLAGTFVGLFQNDDQLTLTNSGLLTLVLKNKGLYSGTLTQGTNTYRFSGQFTPDGATEISRGKLSPLALTLVFDNSTSNLISGTITNGEWISGSGYQAVRAIYSASSKTPAAGHYTLAMDTSESDLGSSVASIVVTPTGRVAFSGSMIDGATLTGAATLCDGSWIPVYLPLNSGRGLVSGWMTLTDSTDSSGLRWLTPGNGVFFTGGYVADLTISLSPFALSGNCALSLTDATLTLSGGNLDEVLTLTATQSANNVFTIADSTTGLNLTISTTTGLVTGTFIHPTTGNATPITAVLLQNSKTITGYFQGTSTSGAIILQAPPK